MSMNSSPDKLVQPASDFVNAADLYGVYQAIKAGVTADGYQGNVSIEHNLHAHVEVLFLNSGKGRRPVALVEDNGVVSYFPVTLGKQNAERLDSLMNELLQISESVKQTAPVPTPV